MTLQRHTNHDGPRHAKARSIEPTRPTHRPRPPAERKPRAEREAEGRELRKKVHRGEHEQFVVAPGRDPLALIQATNESRLPELVPIRWGRMFESPFAFYRGAPAVMAFDLSHTPSTGLHVQACGDAHIMNFGAFATPERNLIVDVNDFDETHPGPWEWDVKRLAASIVILGREVGVSESSCRDAAQCACEGYREHMRELAAMDPLTVYYGRVDATDAMSRLRRSHAEQKEAIAKVRRKSAEAVPKLTELVGDQMRIITRPPIIQPLPRDFLPQIEVAFVDYLRSLREDRRLLAERYRIVDVALKVVGVGSVGTRCCVALLESDGAPLLLQIKEANESVLAPYVKGNRFEHEGHRVVVGQRIMQAASDVFLGWARGPLRVFYVRQLRDMKAGLDPEGLEKQELSDAARLAGYILARAHARSGDAAAMSGYLGKCDTFDDATSRFAVAYADQNEKDYAGLRDAVRSGKIRAIVGT